MHADLLSAGEAADCEGAGEGYERLVSDHAQQTGERLPERVVEIHALEGAQVVAGGVFLHHSGIAARNGRRSE